MSPRSRERLIERLVSTWPVRYGDLDTLKTVIAKHTAWINVQMEFRGGS